MAVDLTQDKVILEQHLDIRGNENIEVLRRGFLNRFYIIFVLIKRGTPKIAPDRAFLCPGFTAWGSIRLYFL